MTDQAVYVLLAVGFDDPISLNPEFGVYVFVSLLDRVNENT